MSKTKSHFNTDHLKSDLKGRTVRGATATFMGQGIRFAINIVSIMALARLLTPEDFGLIAMVAAVTGFIMMFKDLGLTMATIQKEAINHQQVSTLFWISMAISILFMLLTIALAPIVAWFYKEPRLLEVTTAISIAFIFSGLAVQHQALLRRQMRFTAVTTINVISAASGVMVAILLGWMETGYWALVWMQITTAAVSALGVWIVSGWIPGKPVRGSGVREMLSFGGYITTFNFVNYFSRNLDNILIGRYIGSTSLGYYSRAYSLLLLPINQIVGPLTGVALPALSRLQKEPERYRRYYLHIIKTIAYLIFPSVVALMVLSEEIVLLVLGKQWSSAAPIFNILAITAMLHPLLTTTGWVYMSLGQTRRYAIWGAINALLLCISFVIGLQWGVIGIASAYAICTIMLFHPALIFALKNSPVTPVEVYKTVYRPFAVSIVVGAGAMGFRTFLTGMHPIVVMVTVLLSGALALACFIFTWPHVNKDVREIIDNFKIIRNSNER